MTTSLGRAALEEEANDGSGRTGGRGEGQASSSVS
jgi:hypothetical protein